MGIHQCIIYYESLHNMTLFYINIISFTDRAMQNKFNSFKTYIFVSIRNLLMILVFAHGWKNPIIDIRRFRQDSYFHFGNISINGRWLLYINIQYKFGCGKLLQDYCVCSKCGAEVPYTHRRCIAVDDKNGTLKVFGKTLNLLNLCLKCLKDSYLLKKAKYE